MDIFIHNTADINAKTQIGDGTKIWHYVHIRENAKVGSNCIVGQNVYIDANVIIGDRVKIQNNVSIYHGVIVEDDVFLGPSMTFTNDMYPRAFNNDWNITNTHVKKGASIGANATIVCGVTIGEYAMVGAGAVVINNVPAYTLVVGNPAKAIGKVCKCGNRFVGICSVCGFLL